MLGIQRVQRYSFGRCKDIFAFYYLGNPGPDNEKRGNLYSVQQTCQGAQMYVIDIPFRDSDTMVGGSGIALRPRGKWKILCPRLSTFVHMHFVKNLHADDGF